MNTKTKKKPKKDVIRVGDFVKVLDPTKFIERVGYSLIWTDFYDEMQDDPRVSEIAHELGCSGSAFYALCKAAAMGKVVKNKFGGNERKIIYTNDLKENLLVDRIDVGDYYYDYYLTYKFRVTEKKIAKTGLRFPSRYYGEDDYDIGGLDNEKTHILLKIEGKWIESIHVQKVHDGAKS